MTAVIMMIALSMDWLLGELRRWHPLVGFGYCADRIEAWLNAAAVQSSEVARWRGLCAMLLAVAPLVLLCSLLTTLPYAGTMTQVAALYLCVGHRSLHDHAMRVF